MHGATSLVLGECNDPNGAMVGHSAVGNGASDDANVVVVTDVGHDDTQQRRKGKGMTLFLISPSYILLKLC